MLCTRQFDLQDPGQSAHQVNTFQQILERPSDINGSCDSARCRGSHVRIILLHSMLPSVCFRGVRSRNGRLSNFGWIFIPKCIVNTASLLAVKMGR